MNMIKNLERQHIEIRSTISDLKSLLSDSLMAERTIEAAKIINSLAGKLRVHLSSEDKYLYPSLIKSSDNHIKNTALAFDKEMASVFDTFTSFKNNFNTSSKIISRKDDFIHECKSILILLENRIDKEDLNLFPLVK